MSNTAFRGFGGPQGIFIAESYMEEIADRLDIPVERLREINFYKPNEKTHFNQSLKDWHVPIMYQQVLKETSYDERREAVTKFNATHRWKKRGLAIVPTKFGISFTALFLNQAGALVHIYHDGSVLVAHGGTEMGQGLHTKMTMIAAEALGVPLSDVFISGKLILILSCCRLDRSQEPGSSLKSRETYERAWSLLEPLISSLLPGDFW